jgi:aspartokinase/homoserine dehydrogenase 1
MKNHQGLSGRMFSTLGKNNVNIRAIAQGASERNISAVINERDVKKALNTLHENFFEENTKQLNLFVMGVGNVGEKFISQIVLAPEILSWIIAIGTIGDHRFRIPTMGLSLFLQLIGIIALGKKLSKAKA